MGWRPLIQKIASRSGGRICVDFRDGGWIGLDWMGNVVMKGIDGGLVFGWGLVVIHYIVFTGRVRCVLVGWLTHRWMEKYIFKLLVLCMDVCGIVF